MKARSLVAVALFALVALMLAPLAHAGPVNMTPDALSILYDTQKIDSPFIAIDAEFATYKQVDSGHVTAVASSPTITLNDTGIAVRANSALAGNTTCSGRLATASDRRGNTPSLR